MRQGARLRRGPRRGFDPSFRVLPRPFLPYQLVEEPIEAPLLDRVFPDAKTGINAALGPQLIHIRHLKVEGRHAAHLYFNGTKLPCRGEG